jgi:hypothetical protein
MDGQVMPRWLLPHEPSDKQGQPLIRPITLPSQAESVAALWEKVHFDWHLAFEKPLGIERRFAHPVRGRYFCLESLSAQEGKPYAAVAELELLDASGNPLSPTKAGPSATWTARNASAKTAPPRTPLTARQRISGTPNGVPHRPNIPTGSSSTWANRAPSAGSAMCPGKGAPRWVGASKITASISATI